MVFKIGSILTCGLIVSNFFVIQILSSPSENEKLMELTRGFEALQTKLKALEVENEILTAKFGDLEAENTKLRADVKELKVQVSKPNQELLLIKGQNSILESHLSSNRVTYETNQTSKKNENKPSSRGLSGLPSSCKELKAGYTSVPMDGIHLVKRTNKINAVFCTFPMGIVYETFIGYLDIKTRRVHFYVQNNSPVKISRSVLPFQFERLNEGYHMDLVSGIFTAPVPGIYHFEFSGLKDTKSTSLHIILQVNGINIGSAFSDVFATGTYHTVSLSASLRLKAKDRVFLVGNGWLYDSIYHFTHFSGWLVEEDLSP